METTKYEKVNILWKPLKYEEVNMETSKYFMETTKYEKSEYLLESIFLWRESTFWGPFDVCTCNEAFIM